MTKDELLEWGGWVKPVSKPTLQKWLAGDWSQEGQDPSRDLAVALAALRAVVELHTQEPEWRAPEQIAKGAWLNCLACDEAWPCPTIRAVEKEVLR